MKITNELLVKYAQGLCTPEEILAIEAWLMDPEAEANFPANDFAEEKDIIWDSIQRNLGEEETPNRRILPFSRATFWLTAACIVILCGLAVVFLQYGQIQKQDKAILRFANFETKAGEKKRISLIDGTVITLNSESRLHVPEDYAKPSRMVTLEGEAYLEVAKDSLHPLELQTSQTSVRVLGTKFNVKAYPEEHLTTVVVREGKVQFSQKHTTNHKVILTANERGQFSKSGGLSENNVYNYRYLSWVDNRLIFDNDNITDVAKIVERWYGLKIDVSSDIKNERFTGEFHNPPAKFVVEKICYVMGYQYQMKDRHVRIYKSP